MVGLTVLFSTFNGAATLPRMLAALERLEPPPGGWKIVAVDNGSTDDTPALLRKYAAALPITVLAEPRQGKNVGLNRGLTAVEGDLVVFTDDDIIPHEDWLVALRRVADEQQDYDVFGGAIYPVWPQRPPDWLQRCVPLGHFAWTNFNDGPVNPTAIWGPNMAVRREVLNEHRFFEGIGPNGANSYATGAETEFALRVARAGYACWHTRAAVVGHIIEPRQLTLSWQLQRSYNHARGARRLNALHGEPPARNAFERPRDVVPLFAKAALDVAASALFGDFDERLKALLALWELQGDFSEWRLLMKTRD